MVAVYACGGTGVNIGKKLNDLDMDIYFIDTSYSNLRGVNNENVFVVEGIDGAGKDRSKTFEHFKDIAEDILIRFKPSEDINIVISSLSGGSGAVISPLVTRELLKNNKNVIVIGIDSRNSVKEIDNTIKTMKTFKSIAGMVEKPVALYYIENEQREKADKEAIYFINLISLLFDRKNTEELDVSDVSHFIDYTKVTSNQPSVGIIEVTDNSPQASKKDTFVVGSILVTKNNTSTLKEPIPEYAATCVVTDKNYNNEDIRINNVLGEFALIIDELESTIKKLLDEKKISKIKDLEVKASNDHGIVL